MTTELSLRDLDTTADEDIGGIDALMSPAATTEEPAPSPPATLFAAFARELEKGLFSGSGSAAELALTAAAFAHACDARASAAAAAAERSLRAGTAADVASARVAAQEASLARAEAATWDAVRSLYPRRSRRVLSALLAAAEPPSAAAAAATTPAEAVARAADGDDALRELREVVCWLERNAHETAQATLRGDGDDDGDDDSEVVRRCWALVRAGRVADAVEECRAARMPWRAATLAGGEPWDGERRGNPRRALWRAACCAAANDSELPVRERALYGALGGCVDAALECCECWEDALWAHLRTMYDAEIDTVLAGFEPQQQQQQQPHPKSFHDAFAALRTSAKEQVRRECDDVFHIVQEHVVLDDFAGLLPFLRNWSTSGGHHQRALPEAYAVRMAAHLVAFFFHDAVRSPLLPDDAASVIASYTSFLAETGQWELVAFYASLLPPEMSVEHYSQLLAASGPVSAERRTLLIHAADRAGLPFQAVTARVAELLAQSAANPQQEGEEVSKMSEAVRWLCFDPSQWQEAVTAANEFARELLGHGNIEAARQVVDVLPPRRPLSVKGKRTLEEKELRWTRQYLAARDAFTSWHEHNARKPPPPPSSAMQQSTTRGGYAESLLREREQKAFDIEQRKWSDEDERMATDADAALVATLEKARPLQQRHTKMKALVTELLACLCTVRRVWQPPSCTTPCAGIPALITAEPNPLFDSLSDDRLKAFLMLFRELAVASLH